WREVAARLEGGAYGNESQGGGAERERSGHGRGYPGPGPDRAGPAAGDLGVHLGRKGAAGADAAVRPLEDVRRVTIKTRRLYRPAGDRLRADSLSGRGRRAWKLRSRARDPATARNRGDGCASGGDFPCCS